jgi:hypothetical protein
LCGFRLSEMTASPAHNCGASTAAV